MRFSVHPLPVPLGLGEDVAECAREVVFERIIWEHLGSHAVHFDPSLVGTFWDRAGPLALTQLIIAYYLVKMRELAIERGHLRVA